MGPDEPQPTEPFVLDLNRLCGHQHALAALARHLLGDAERAADVVQETLLAATRTTRRLLTGTIDYKTHMRARFRMLLPEELAEYARQYQSARLSRCKLHGAVFLPLETLTHFASEVTHLSVSFSGTGFADCYFTKRASLYRAVRITLRFLIIPGTVSRLLTQQAFVDLFGDLMGETTIDGEDFWVIREASQKELRLRIRNLELDNGFRSSYRHEYLPEPRRGA